MSSPDAIPSRGDVVVVPDYLREILRQTAERKLREACDLAFPPDQRDEVIEAVHLVDAFTYERVTADVVLALIPSAIAWKQSETVSQVGGGGRSQQAHPRDGPRAGRVPRPARRRDAAVDLPDDPEGRR